MTITTTQLRRKVSLADSATQGDIVVTKRGELFVVIMDDKRYEELIVNQREGLITPKKPRVCWEEKFKEGGVNVYINSIERLFIRQRWRYGVSIES